MCCITHNIISNNCNCTNCVLLRNHVVFSEDAEYDELMNNYGDTVDFLITDVNTYEVEWQKCSGDPHGQGAETPVDNNTLCWDFAGSEYGGRSIMLWEDVPNCKLLLLIQCAHSFNGY